MHRSPEQKHIQVLPERLANRIAAGEVAERPAAVLKELIENSLDAGARRIEVRLEQGGKELISVRDDGFGMGREDAVLALRRHATSKIAAAEDLDAILTMGFRGEALPSVAAVSRLEMLTRPAQDEMGTRILVEGGKTIDVGETGAPAGTVLTVRDLFFNVPARRRFLRTAPAELRRCTEVFTRAATVFPQISFTYVVDGRRRTHYPAAEGLEDRIAAVLGANLAESMVRVEHQEYGISIRGMVGGPGVYRTSRSHQLLFVNQRPVQHRGLAGAIYALYRDHLRAGQFPIYVLLIEIDPSRIDVNIHPAKSEIRFRETKEASRAVRHAIAQVIRGPGVMPRWEPLAAPRNPEVHEQSQLNWNETTPLGGIRERAAALGAALAQEMGVEPPDPSPDEEPGSAAAHPLGMASCWQFARTYIFTPLKGDLVMVDQHTAHERVLFEQTMAAILQGDVPAQRLLFPVVLELDPAEQEAARANATEIARVGYEVEWSSASRISLIGVPAVGRDARAGQVFHSFLGELAETDEGRLAGIEKVAATFACKAAVKAGDALTGPEMAQLVNQVFATRRPFFCPHGRPTVVRISLAEIERRFGRI